MSVKKTLSLNSKAVKIDNDVNDDQVITTKRRRTDRCLSFVEVSIEPGKTLKHLDSKKIKLDIKRWAKAVVAYARQVSGRFGSSSRSRFGSSRRSGRIGSWTRDSSQDSS